MTHRLLVLLMALVSTALASNQTSITPQDIAVATQEMQKANYFTFVMLLNMAPSDLLGGGGAGAGITFLMPNDRTLSKTDLSESSVVDFLLRHSIPSPLLIDHLDHFPTGSMIPTSKPDFMFKVTNDGRRRLFLSNVRIVSPNICTKGSNIRCHGIDGVAQPEILPEPGLPPPPPATCANGSSTSAVGPAPQAVGPAPQPAVGGGFVVTVAAPPSVVKIAPSNSGSIRDIGHGEVVQLVVAFFMVIELLWF